MKTKTKTIKQLTEQLYRITATPENFKRWRPVIYPIWCEYDRRAMAYAQRVHGVRAKGEEWLLPENRAKLHDVHNEPVPYSIYTGRGE